MALILDIHIYNSTVIFQAELMSLIIFVYKVRNQKETAFMVFCKHFTQLWAHARYHLVISAWLKEADLQRKQAFTMTSSNQALNQSSTGKHCCGVFVAYMFFFVCFLFF